MPICIIIRGPLGVGKTTIARKLATPCSARYFSIDQILEELGLDIVEGTSIPITNFLKVNQYIHDQITNKNINVIVDGNFYFKEQLEDLLQKLKEFKVSVFTLKASLETCIERDKQRTKSYGANAVQAVYSLVNSFDFGTSINTNSLSEDEVIEEVARLL